MNTTEVSRHDHLADATHAISQRVRQQVVRCGLDFTVDHQAGASHELGKLRDADKRAEEAPPPKTRQHVFVWRGKRQRQKIEKK